MKLTLAAALLLLIAGCGSSDPKADKPESPKSTTAADNSAECDRLAREWAVAAGDLGGKYTLGLNDDAKATLDKMTTATDSMKVELCKTRANDVALMANYEASLANAHLLVCDQSDMDCWFKVSDEWKAKGEPLVTEVETLAGLS